MQGGTLPVISGLTPGKPIYFWPFIRGPCPSVYNDGAHLVGLVSVYLYNDVDPGIVLGPSPVRGSRETPKTNGNIGSFGCFSHFFPVSTNAGCS